MRIRIILNMLFISSLLCVNLFAQSLPLVYDVENTNANYPKPPLPTLDQLPSFKALPDPFAWADGRGRISSIYDWQYRRAEIGTQIQNYEIGTKPPRPDSIEASYSGGVLTVKVTVNGKSLTITSQVILPSGTGPFPAVIGIGTPSGSVPATVFSSRNIAQISFQPNQLTTDGSASNSNPYYKLYSNFNIDITGQYSAWIWGVSRLIDGLELIQNILPIDLKHIAVTGCSRWGKLALYAGAFDERIALTIAQESGGGGATSWRYSHSEPSGSVECIDNTDYNWFMNSMKQFSGDNVSKMPTDHHELMAMVAPRALFVSANPDYLWLSNPSCHVASIAAKEVYKTLGIEDRFGYSIIGGHGHCSVPNSQLPEIEAFVDKFLLGKDSVYTNIETTPYSIDVTSWITWTNPILSTSISSVSWTSLIYPANLQKGLDKTITLKWKKAKDAAQYKITLATDPLFKNVVLSGSTTIDTVKTISGLSDGTGYYWRVQVKNNAGIAGPWSDVWSFSTFINLPATPQLLNAAPYQNRGDYITLKWRKAKDAEKYIIQLADNQTFARYLLKDSISVDTVKTLSGLYEAQIYYWRVQSKNVAGLSAWSDVAEFTTLLPAPTNLALQKSGDNEITLSWTDNASSEYGYIVERKVPPQSSFSLLDSLRGSKNSYADKSIGQTETYSYRVKAFARTVESEYSNEASLYIVGVDEEEIPAEYSISQNYPNPFNPATKIKFTLPQMSQTKIIIYDVLGREMQTLINKELEAGSHEINFDANNLPSGIYFYKIQSGNFVQTKKMILTK